MSRNGTKKTLPGEKNKSPLRAFIIIFAFFVVLLCVYPGNNLFTYFEARREIRQQRRQMRDYQRDIVRMQNSMDFLTGDVDTLEKFARENFHFAQPGEDIYLIDE